jgi:hypothetical protein
VIGSGDHGFIARALAVRARGVGVLVVSRRAALCRGWRAHHFPVVELEPGSRAASDLAPGAPPRPAAAA